MLIRVTLPFHLRQIARIADDLELDVPVPVTIRSLLDTLEEKYPALRGTIRDHDTHKRRPFIRFFACQEDLSLADPNTSLPAAILAAKEPFLIIGALAGG